MKNAPSFAAFAVLTCILSSCYPTSREMLKPEGETANVTMFNGHLRIGDFLYATDSSVIVLSNAEVLRKDARYSRRICSIPLSSVKSIQIANFANRRWVVPLIGFQLIPTIVFGIEVAANTERVEWGTFLLVLGTPILITYLILEGGTPADPIINSPFTDMKDFSKYARFPKGLDDSQLAELLKLYGQTEVEQLR